MSLVDRLRKWQTLAIEYATGTPVIFHHIPKCGGTSVGRALRLRYLLSQDTVHPIHSYAAVEAFFPDTEQAKLLDAMRDFREQMLLYLIFEKVRCISAHVHFSQPAYESACAQYKFVTVLRDPVERFVSHYFHSLNRNDYSRVSQPIDAFIETEQARDMGATLSKYLCGLPSGSDFASEEAVSSAIVNLEKFDAIGFLDKLPSFEKRLREILGVGLRIGHENAGAHGGGGYKARLEPKILAAVVELCAPDIAIFEAARRFG